MKPVFADAFYFVALFNRADQHHQRVVAAACALRVPILTTQWVLMEFADALAASASRRLVPGMLRELEADPKVEIVHADSGLFHGAMDFYEQRPDKDWSLTDCTSFIVMEEHGIREALTGDHHFEQADFVALLKS